ATDSWAGVRSLRGSDESPNSCRPVRVVPDTCHKRTARQPETALCTGGTAIQRGRSHDLREEFGMTNLEFGMACDREDGAEDGDGSRSSSAAWAGNGDVA